MTTKLVLAVTIVVMFALPLLVLWLRRWLIQRALRTPYFHLDGYMERYWLVPYAKPLARTLTSWLRQPVHTTLDGTVPVSWWRPIAKILQKFDIAVRVHHILTSDKGDTPHDHPWPFVSVILKGGYYEKRYDQNGVMTSLEWHGPGSILYRKPTDFHMLWLPEGETAWTLFITGKYCQTWGFKPKNSPKIPYKDFLG